MAERHRTSRSSKLIKSVLQTKVIIIGDSGVGKTNLLTRYCEGIFKQSYVATIGVDFKIKTVDVEDTRIKLQIWDTAGQQRFRNVTQTYFKGARGIILVYAIDNQKSFKNIRVWLKQIQNNTQQQACLLLIGSKSDNQKDRQVSTEQGQKLAKQFRMSFMQVSSKNGDNVDQAFMLLTVSIKATNNFQVKQIKGDEKKVGSINLAAGSNQNNKSKKCQC